MTYAATNSTYINSDRKTLNNRFNFCFINNTIIARVIYYEIMKDNDSSSTNTRITIEYEATM